MQGVQPTLKVITPDGRSLDVWLGGPADGQPLLFHHGTPGSGKPFAHHVRALADRGMRYVGASRAGYGGSTRREGRSVADGAADSRAVLDHLGIDRAWILGWSGGGPHALACAALLPDRILGTALIAGVAPFEAPGLDWLAGMGAENVEEFGAVLTSGEALRAFIEPAAAQLRAVRPDEIAAAFGDLIDDVDRDSLTEEFATYLAEGDHEAMREGFWGWYDDDVAFTRPWGFDLAAIPGRVHIWQGAHDRMVPFAHGQWLAAHCGGACSHVFDRQGHLSLAVEQFPAILDELLAGAPA
jgi:pimeloyl-ACP methyl ester carboxylesterase